MQAWQREAIRNLLAILGGGVLCAGLLAGWMIYKYNPSGSYVARNVLLAPKMMEGLSFKEGKQKLEFEGIDYSYSDGKRMQHVNLPQNLYSRFYNNVESERSLTEVPERIIAGFNSPQTGKMVLRVKSDKGSQSLQEIEFLPQGDYFRVRLRESAANERWVYYYHPQIVQEIERLLLEITP